MPIAALIGAAASLGNALYQNEANENSWLRQNEYNSPVNQMARFQQAGLNPNLIYGNGTSSAGNADSPPNAVGMDQNYIGLVQQAMALKQQDDHFREQLALQQQKFQEQQRVNDANISSTQARTAGLLLDNQYKSKSNPFKIELAKWQANMSRYNALSSKFRLNYLMPLQRDILQFALDRKNWERNNLWDLEKNNLTYRNNALFLDNDWKEWKKANGYWDADFDYLRARATHEMNLNTRFDNTGLYSDPSPWSLIAGWIAQHLLPGKDTVDKSKNVVKEGFKTLSDKTEYFFKYILPNKSIPFSVKLYWHRYGHFPPGYKFPGRTW